jgi:hypothetical protein
MRWERPTISIELRRFAVAHEETLSANWAHYNGKTKCPLLMLCTAPTRRHRNVTKRWLGSCTLEKRNFCLWHQPEQIQRQAHVCLSPDSDRDIRQC